MFAVTYETVTPESAEYGEADERGWILEGGTLRDAWEVLRNAGAIGRHVEADSHPVRDPRWFTFYDVSEDYATGAATSYSVHLPPTVSPASRMRLARLFGCYGAA